MEDTRTRQKNKAPMKTDQRVVVLSPINESYHGPQYDYSPPTRGDVPKDNLGFFPDGTSEVPDEEFRDWPESE